MTPRQSSAPLSLCLVHHANFVNSEKARIPAWTDRILRKGTNVRQLSYNSAPLRFSDHRPVYATFECTASVVHGALRDKISREIYLRRKAEVGDGTANLNTEDTDDDEDLIGYDSIEPGLPPASSDRQKWWLENGKMARSTATPPKAMSSSQQTILNPKRPSNPFSPTEEADWVSVPRSESRLSSFSSMSTSPYEHINHSTILSTSASSSMPRKLPPPYDPGSLTTKVGRLNIEPDVDHRASDAPPPPPPRRQTGPTNTTASRSQTMPINVPPQRKPVNKPIPTLPPRRPASVASQHSTKAKPAPPVAKKPAHLTAVSPASSSPKTVMSEGHLPMNVAGRIQKPQRRRRSSAGVLTLPSSYDESSDPAGGWIPTGHPSTSDSGQGRGKEAAPPQRRPVPSGDGVRTPGRVTPAAGVALPGMSEKYERAKLPAPKPAVAAKPHLLASNSSRTPDLLGDDSGMEISGWEALKPS